MTASPYHVTIVSHTHWDREWYEPFQVFRFQLVELIDDLLDLLDTDPGYRSFLLDGQTIVLEDYLAIRPEREADLRRHIQGGRLLIGPWHILPDEFLVSAEATVRNLMLGARVSARMHPGARMPIGYTPDPFGHIGQLPQILAGCGLDTAALQRGLSDEPTELWWEAPDGTRLLLIYFRAGYGNLAWAPTTSAAFTRAVERQLDRLAPHAHTPCLLLLNGTDHMHPQRELPALIAAANERLAGRAVLRHGTLPEFAAAVRQHLGDGVELPVVRGELRSPKRTPLLPGVYSARMWVKQHNWACQTALERFAEPVSALAQVLGEKVRSGDLWQAWRYLIENHPHDSICGCSVDQVHEEMRTRFAWSRQIADRVTGAGLHDLAGDIDLARFPAVQYQPAVPAPDEAVLSAPSDQAVVIYNPVPGPRTGEVEIAVRWAGPRQRYQLLDGQGAPISYRVLAGQEIMFEDREIAPGELMELVDQIEVGFYRGRLISDVALWIEGDRARLEMVLPEYHTGRIGDFAALADRLRRDPRLLAVTRAHLVTYLADVFRLGFVARDVPGVGYRAYRLAAVPQSAVPGATAAPAPLGALDHEWLRVEVSPQDGTLTVTDKATGRTLRGLNRLQDEGDRGDEYNHCSPERDTWITAPLEPPTIEFRDQGDFGQFAVIHARYALPASLSPDRAARSPAVVEMPVTTTVRLLPGQRRVDVHTALDNPARDHRLRVLFPCGVSNDRVIVDGHFDRLERRLMEPVNTDDWAEQPASTAAQCAFSAVERDGVGLVVAARGLPEYEHIRDSAGSTLALTLLRSVGWLSRDDLACRPGHAGPARATPGAQCLGPSSFDYSVIPFGGGGFALADAAREAYAFSAPMRGAVADPVAGRGAFLPPSLSLVDVHPVEWVLTAVKPAESGEGIIVRFYNSATELIRGQVTFGLAVQRVEPVNLLEEPVDLEWSAVNDHTLALDVPAKRIVTLRIVFRPAWG